MLQAAANVGLRHTPTLPLIISGHVVPACSCSITPFCVYDKSVKAANDHKGFPTMPKDPRQSPRIRDSRRCQRTSKRRNGRIIMSSSLPPCHGVSNDVFHCCSSLAIAVTPRTAPVSVTQTVVCLCCLQVSLVGTSPTSSTKNERVPWHPRHLLVDRDKPAACT